jgi:hypothetical protein
MGVGGGAWRIGNSPVKSKFIITGKGIVLVYHRNRRLDLPRPWRRCKYMAITVWITLGNFPSPTQPCKCYYCSSARSFNRLFTLFTNMRSDLIDNIWEWEEFGPWSLVLLKPWPTSWLLCARWCEGTGKQILYPSVTSYGSRTWQGDVALPALRMATHSMLGRS